MDSKKIPSGFTLVYMKPLTQKEKLTIGDRLRN